ncbi:MAG: hypothetical protein PHN75_15440 [Syntrophales bacterium]|nr:hypothetical protein [Syntrophales bacterium]
MERLLAEAFCDGAAAGIWGAAKSVAAAMVGSHAIFSSSLPSPFEMVKTYLSGT